MQPARRLPVGAETGPRGGVHFRVWAPRWRRVEAVLEDANGRALASLALTPEAGGYFSGSCPEARAGALYRYRLGGKGLFPDPASRFQPQGPHGPSQVVDPSGYRWQDRRWRGASIERQVIYEMHIGTFTREGTWAAAEALLPRLAETGLTLLEIMPVSDFPGRFGWGYDVSNLYAPTRLYGEPDDFRRFVDRAHASGLGVILDVVYNHFGPDGNYLGEFSKDYLSARHGTDWGPALNYDGVGREPVREFVISNAAYWISEFHLDGLRLDATQNIEDDSRRHVIAALTDAARKAAKGKPIVVVAENEPQDARLARPEKNGGLGLDALWNDDFHHSAFVALTGSPQAYYSGYAGAPQEFISALLRGFLYQGQYYRWQRHSRGGPALDLPARAFIQYLENHDQVANSLDGRRRHQVCHPGLHRAMTALLLLAPQTPMLFQGQEFNASAPFLYFADHSGRLRAAVRRGRKKFLSQFKSVAAASEVLPDPADPGVFTRCKLDHRERDANPGAAALHRDLLTLRRTDAVFDARRSDRLAGAVLGPSAFVLRFFGTKGEDRLLTLNLAAERSVSPACEPLLAPPATKRWEMIWSSERPEYGGGGAVAPVDKRGEWRLPAHAATVMRAAPHG